MLLDPLPPLALYIHYPWCVRKCPYCDFNSHPLGSAHNDRAYVEALIADFGHQYAALRGRVIQSVFIGGGSPSLLPGPDLARLLDMLRDSAELAEECEITLETNPGAADLGRFAAYRQAGVNRLSMGAQSFDDRALSAIGRIHDAAQVVQAVRAAQAAGFERLNLDLMFGLPGQSRRGALDDLEQAIALGPSHLSWYQLTLEPNTPFHQSPPTLLPDEDELADTQEAGQVLLAARGFPRYEVSAHAKADQQCRHNLNYWRFGDYLGIGAGAHGKLSGADGSIIRHRKERGPRRYLDRPTAMAASHKVVPEELPLEFMLNALRLCQGFAPPLFEARTGLPLEVISDPLRKAEGLGLLHRDAGCIRPTESGLRFLNDLIGLFAP